MAYPTTRYRCDECPRLFETRARLFDHTVIEHGPAMAIHSGDVLYVEHGEASIPQCLECGEVLVNPMSHSGCRVSDN